MNSNKVKNNQKFKNNQKDVVINAWWNVYNWINNNQEITDNTWYEIPKEEKWFFEIISKFIISKIWEKWWIFTSILSIILWLILSIKNVFWLSKNYLNSVSENFFNNHWDFLILIQSIVLNKNYLLFMLWALLIIIWWLILMSIEYKKDSQCPKCKKQYALKEIWTPKEKELKTSEWYRVYRIRNYKCDYCDFEKEEKINFIRSENG
jgi:hypothetical protein